MESLIKVFGARAVIHLRYEGGLQSPAGRLSSGLMVPIFRVEHRESPPHDLAGSLEVLGWELWLEEASNEKSFQYSLRMETEHSFQEAFDNDMHDLSPWLARYVSLVCDVESLVSGTRIVFRQGKPRRLD
jgi:hypothetical protein